MSDRMTSITLPGCRDAGVAERGLQSVAHMIAMYREKARAELEAAQAILAAADSDFRVKTYLGVYVEREPRILQDGRGGRP